MRRFRPHCELLEDRAHPAIFTVTQPLDTFLKDGSPTPGGLRWAIEQANLNPNRLNPDNAWDEIHFGLPPGHGDFVITLQQPLGPVLEAVVLDASQQPGLSPEKGGEVFVLVPEWPDPASLESMTLVHVSFGLFTKVPDRPVEVPGTPPPPTHVPTDPVDPVDPELPIDPSIPDLLIEPAPGMPAEAASLDRFFQQEEVHPASSPGLPKRRFTALAGESESVFLPGAGEDTGKIIGQLFEDYNGDGRFDADEPPAVDRVVYLDLDRNGRLDPGEPAALTNQRGQYRFEHLRPGYYQVEQLLTPYLVQTLPKSGGNGVELSAGEVIMDVDFGAVKVRKRRVNVSTPDGDSRLPRRPGLFSSLALPLLLGGLISQRPQRQAEVSR
jgi:hypothetical protein